MLRLLRFRLVVEEPVLEVVVVHPLFYPDVAQAMVTAEVPSNLSLLGVEEAEVLVQ